MQKIRLLAVVPVLFLLAACLPGGGANATATLPPIPSPSLPPAATLPGVPTATEPGPGAPTAAPPDGQPVEAIAILQPGPGSRVVSPLRVSGTADPTFEQSLLVTLLLADGSEVTTGATQIEADIGQRGPYTIELPFSVDQEQQGFVQVYATSAKDGGVTHLSSVGIILAPAGEANIVLETEQPERIVIHQPQVAATISGGLLRVEGFGLASFEQTLVIDILDEEGLPLASTPVTVAAPDLGQPGPFSADMRYSVSAETAGRVQVRDVSPAHGGSSHLSSVEVRLFP